MKYVLSFALWLFLVGQSLYAQAPQGISYQAVVSVVVGTVLANQAIAAGIYITTGTTNANILYIEEHAATANTFGFFNLVLAGVIVSNPGPGVSYNGYNYPTIVLGNGQEWMAENLRTTDYNDGTPITLVTDANQWAANYTNGTTLPMMCWYDNDPATYTANGFGALYNWYAVSPTTNGNRNVCPVGWHVPTDAEWTVLTDYLGGANVAGGKMKSTGTQYWQSPNTDATNESGFSGLPGGGRARDVFSNIGNSGFWWSSTEYFLTIAWTRSLNNNEGVVDIDYYNKDYGMSVRCLRD